MIFSIIFAVTAGVLVGISRQVNGRRSVSTSPMVSSFYNHIVGCVIQHEACPAPYVGSLATFAIRRLKLRPLPEVSCGFAQ